MQWEHANEESYCKFMKTSVISVGYIRSYLVYYICLLFSFDVDWYILSLIINTISFLPRRLKCKPCRFLQLCICRGSSNVREVSRYDGSIIFLRFRFTEAILLLSLKLSGKVAQPLRQSFCFGSSESVQLYRSMLEQWCNLFHLL